MDHVKIETKAEFFNFLRDQLKRHEDDPDVTHVILLVASMHNAEVVDEDEDGVVLTRFPATVLHNMHTMNEAAILSYNIFRQLLWEEQHHDATATRN